MTSMLEAGQEVTTTRGEKETTEVVEEETAEVVAETEEVEEEDMAVVMVEPLRVPEFSMELGEVIRFNFSQIISNSVSGMLKAWFIFTKSIMGLEYKWDLKKTKP